MKPIKFRQAIFEVGGFERWHYWGFVGPDDEFVGPMSISGKIPVCNAEESQQYIGRNDCNGVEIYEGDRVKANKFDSREYVVEWHQRTLEYLLREYLLGDKRGGWSKPGLGCEVVGHIYEKGRR